MPDAPQNLPDKIKSLTGSLTAYTALGSFLLYFFGYLTLRFHLTMLGVNTDLAVLDERYFFAGASFLVNLVAVAANAIFVSIALAGLGWLAYRATARLRSSKRGKAVSAWLRAFYSAKPGRVMLTGILFSIGLIQLVMRQCMTFENLLLTQYALHPDWLAGVRLNEDKANWFFVGLLLGVGVSALLYFAARRQPAQTTFSRALGYVLVFLLAVEFLLLPVNFGVLISEPAFARVANLGGKEALKPGQEAWMIWEGKEWTTYLVRSPEGGHMTQALVSLPNKDRSRIQIACYDQLFRILFAGEHSKCAAAAAEDGKLP
ncbi:MAG TPA: hypothetical protein VIX89_08030 [Bryobacteraceae bacterium]